MQDATQITELKTENSRLRRRLRALERERKALREERDEYLRALMARFKKEAQADLDSWKEIDLADYKYTLEDIFAHIEKETGICLPKIPNSESYTPARSRKNSRSSSAKRKKQAS